MILSRRIAPLVILPALLLTGCGDGATETRPLADPPIIVEGMTVSVDVFDESHTIISISRFFPEPAE